MPDETSNTQLWQQDLDYLAEQIRRRHANPYHRIAREQFEAAVAALRDRIPHLQRHQIIVEMARIVAMIGDGHTTFWLSFNTSLKFQHYPLRFYQFSDGVFVYEADAEYRAYLGAKLVRVCKYRAEEALTQVENVVPRDNAVGLQLAAAHTLSVPEVLHTLGIVENLESGEFTLEDANGKRFIVDLPALPPAQEPSQLRLCDNETPLALWQQRPERLYWFEYLEPQHVVYMQHRVVGSMDDEPFAQFCQRLFDFIETHPVERLVIDLRNNSGGNNTLNPPLVHGLICCDKINQRGRLFTIIGRRTFSAAMNLTVDLERNTRTLFVGEPTGSSPNFYGETTDNRLPHSGITFSVSTLYWQSSLPYDKRPYIEPHIRAEISSADYRNNVDPALNAILSYVHDDSLYDYEPVKYPHETT